MARRGIFGTVYAPVKRGVNLGRRTVKSGIHGVESIVGTGLGAVSKVADVGLGFVGNTGENLASSLNGAVDNVYQGTVGRVMSRRRRGGKRRSHRRRSHRRRTHRRRN